MRAASVCKNSMGAKRKCDVPSRHTVWSGPSTRPSARRQRRAWARGGGKRSRQSGARRARWFGRHPDVGVEVEAIALRLARAARGEGTEGRLVAEAADAGAGAGAEGDATLDGGAHEAGEAGRGIGEEMGGRAVGCGLE